MSNDIQKTSEILSSLDPAVYIALKNSIYPGATDESIAMAVSYCKAAKLDILLKPVHIVPMYVIDQKTKQGSYRDTVMPGIGLYRIQAARNGCAGISEPEFGETIMENLDGYEIKYPKTCKVTVKRIVNGHMAEFSATELWKENYATAGKDKKFPNAMWKKRPFAQLAKCAEAQALRKAFPELGSVPTAEEMEGKEFYSSDVESFEKEIIPGKGVNGLKEKLGIIETKEDIEDAVLVEEKNEVAEADFGSIEYIKKKIASATNINDLTEAVDLVNQLKNLDEKTSLMKIYKEKKKEIDSK